MTVIRFDSMVRSRLTLPFCVSVGTHPSQVQNVEWKWLKLRDRLKNSHADKRTLAEFEALLPDRQLREKNNGYFVGAQFKFGTRRNANISLRSILTVDIDLCPPALLRSLAEGTSGLGDTEYVVYSTRKHSQEKPRIRIVIPLAKLCPLDKFVPVMRVLASLIDPEMKTVDPVSYKISQFMYWPSHCADQTPVFIHHEGSFLDVDGTLDAWGWTGDYATLPKSPREQALREQVGTKNDPRKKKNFVGAFCRAYDVHQVIEKFLPELYSVSERDENGVPLRYSYVPGTTANGLVVYDDGLFVSSFQGSDPVSQEANPNAFDFARIHMFADLDELAEADTRPQDLPSYEAMERRFKKDPDVKLQGLAGWDYPVVDDDVFDDIPLPDEAETAFLDPGADGPIEKQTSGKVRKLRDWKESLEVNDDGLVKPTVPNLHLILEFFPTFKGRFAYDEFINDVVQVLPIRSESLGVYLPGRSRLDPFGRVGQAAIDVVRLLLWSPRGEKMPGWGLRYSNEDIEQSIRLIAMKHRVHPVREWLQSLEGTWDGKPRVEKLWIRGCGTPDTPYYRNTARIQLLAAVARVFEPGCKYDDACILEGPQGTRKSSFVKALGGIWGGETEGHFADEKKFVESTLGFWIIEIPELVQFGKSEIQAIKACMSRQRDHVRLSYKKFAETFMRQSVLIGTTNEDKYLRDATGGRRFLPIKIVGKCDVEWLVRHRAQIFAEVMHAYRAMRAAQPHGDLPLYQVDDEQAKVEQAARVVEDGTDEWRGMIEHYVNRLVPKGQEQSGAPLPEGFDEDGPLVPRKSFCTIEIAAQVLQVRGKDYDGRMAARLNRILRELPGWQEHGPSNCGTWGKQRQYRRVLATQTGDATDL